MKKLVLLLLVLGLLQPVFANGKTTYKFSGWIDESEFESTFKIDTHLVPKTNWETISSSQVDITGYFYTNKSGEPVFKVTKIDIPEKIEYQPQQDELESVEQNEPTYQYNYYQGDDQSGD